MDMISSLPNEIILLIGGFLSAKNAATVSILSKRFRNLFTVIQNLEFDESTDPLLQNLTAFLDEILALPETTTHIHRFSLKCRRPIERNRLNNCLREVAKRSVTVFELDIHGDNKYSPVLEIFNWKTVVNMKLGNKVVIGDLPTNAFLPALETLHLDTVRFYALHDCAFEALLLACPVLKELIIDDMYWETWKWSGVLSSHTLQRLTIVRIMSEDFQGPGFQSITLDTPALDYLEYYGFVPDEYPVVNLDSIVEAKLDLQVVVNREWHGIFPVDGDLISSNPSNLIQGLRNVQILHLESPICSETFYFFREAIPVFDKLHHLTITHDDTGFCWRFLPFLLNRTPYLNTLVIECGLHYVAGPEYVCDCLLEYSFLLACPLKVLEIDLWDGGTVGELEQVRHFVGKLSCLELLNVTSSGIIGNMEKLRIATELLMLPRASSKCKVQLNFH